MRRGIQQAFAVAAVALVASAAIGGLAATGHNVEDVSPVGTAEASHDCGLANQLAIGIAGATGQLVAEATSDCDFYHGQTGTESIDHNQTRTELVQRAATTFQHQRAFLDSLNNSAQNARAIARLDAQAAYYRSLENGSSENVARIAARNAVEDYYAVKQTQLARSYETFALDVISYETLEDAESLSEGFVGGESYDHSTSATNNSVQLVNASTIDVATHPDLANPWGSTSGNKIIVGDENNPDYETVYSPDIKRYVSLWHTFESDADTVSDDIDRYINQTYDAYESGEVEASQLVDSNTLSRSFTGDNTQSWSTLALTTTSGVDPPENMSQIGSYEVKHDDIVHTGILLADTKEVSSIQSGQTYNGSKWSVTPKIATSDGLVALDGEFTVQTITDSEGNSINSTDFATINYTTTDTEGYKQLMGQLDALRSELEEREEQDSNGGLFGGLLGGIGGIGLFGAVALVVVGYLAYTRTGIGDSASGVTVKNRIPDDIQNRVRDRKDD